MDEKTKENWVSGDPYELYASRWSRKVAIEFLDWISVPARSSWADVGCGTGALAQCILDRCDPRFVAAIDKADGFVATARRIITDPRVTLGPPMQQSCLGKNICSMPPFQGWF